MDTVDLDSTVISFSDPAGVTAWTIRDAVEGTQIFGGIGSGKTSGSGRMIALKYLSLGFGGLVLTVKPDERDLWQEYCRMTGREQDLLILEPGCPHFFNFMAYEAQAAGGKPITDNIVQVLKTVIRASEEKSSGKSDDPFWETALDMLIFNLIELCLLAYGTVSIQALYDIAQSIPKMTEDGTIQEPAEDNPTYYDEVVQAAWAKVNEQVAAWEQTQPPDELSALNDRAYKEKVAYHIPDARRMKQVVQFLNENFIRLNEKTRSIIDFSLTGFLFRLLQEPVYSLFCQHPSTFTPEQCFEQGKIILLNLPVKTYHKAGRDTQILFKYIWQRAMEKRNIKLHQRPVFLWADEAQNFLHEYDADYQATARSSRIATVYISQNLPNYYANMGGEKGKFKVKSFLGTLGTKIFHANADIETNRYASELIGEAYQREESESTASVAGKISVTTTVSSKLTRIVRPELFPMLSTGGPLNKHIVSAYILLQGKKFSNGHIFRKSTFNQNAKP